MLEASVERWHARGEPAPDAQPIVVIGLGADGGGDAAAGVEASRILAALELPGVRCLERPCEGTALMDAWCRSEMTFVLAARADDDDPGRIQRLDARVHGIPAGLAGEHAHACGLGDALELSRALGELPRRLVLYTISGRDWSPQGGLSPPVRRAVDELVELVSAEIVPILGTNRAWPPDPSVAAEAH